MSLTIILIVSATVLTVMGIRIYLEEKNKAIVKNTEATEIDNNNEKIVAERIAEIAAFENEVAEIQEQVKVEAQSIVEQKKPVKKKRYYSPKKSQAKGKNKK